MSKEAEADRFRTFLREQSHILDVLREYGCTPGEALIVVHLGALIQQGEEIELTQFDPELFDHERDEGEEWKRSL